MNLILPTRLSSGFNSNHIATARLSADLGLDMLDLDVKTIGSEVAADDIRSLLHHHQLLCFRDQRLTPQDLVNFTRVFGAPDPHVLQQYTLPGCPEIFVISNIVEDGKPIGELPFGGAEVETGWHTDLTYLPLPAAYTILYGIENPPTGADTIFASLYKAYDALDAADRALLRGRNGLYSYRKLYAKRKNAPALTPEQQARTPDVAHPLVRVHPDTKREGMYLNKSDCIGVEGMAPEEGVALVTRLFDYTVENFSYRHCWRDRDLIIWDNRGLLHTATPYDVRRHRRLVHRTTVQGERPISSATG